jgi:hypothetical protein
VLTAVKEHEFYDASSTRLVLPSLCFFNLLSSYDISVRFIFAFLLVASTNLALNGGEGSSTVQLLCLWKRRFQCAFSRGLGGTPELVLKFWRR